MQELIEKVRQGSPRALARLISRVENSDQDAAEAVRALYADTGRAHVVGITGPPGSGKSSLVTEIAKEFRQREHKLGIVAVDPSSPFTGGALLGDRVRMQELSGDAGVFIRSMASRGSLGGLAKATAAVIKLLDAAGFQTILVETVGAGQSEVDIAQAAHTTLVIEAPDMGDDVQSIKAGILEIADILVVNKADKPGAARTVKGLEMMLHMGPQGGTRHHGRIMDSTAVVQQRATDEQAWQIPVIQTSALNGTGIDALVDKIVAHGQHLRATGQWLEREQQRSRREVELLLRERFMARFEAAVSVQERDDLLAAVARREMDPYTAVEKLFEKI